MNRSQFPMTLKHRDLRALVRERLRDFHLYQQAREQRRRVRNDVQRQEKLQLRRKRAYETFPPLSGRPQL